MFGLFVWNKVYPVYGMEGDEAIIDSIQVAKGPVMLNELRRRDERYSRCNGSLEFYAIPGANLLYPQNVSGEERDTARPGNRCGPDFPVSLCE